MPRKKELPAPDSGEQDNLLSTEPQKSPQKVRPMRVRRMKMLRRRNTQSFFRR